MIKKFSSINAQKPSGKAEVKEGIISVNDGKLFYRKVGKGFPLIVLHGGPGLDQDYLLPQLYKLAENNLVIFYDQRGSGRSLDTKLNEQYLNTHQFVEDLENLRKSLGIDKFILMGHSWGGFLAMHYAIEHQDHLVGLILLNTAPADSKGIKAFKDEFELRTKNIRDDIKPLFAYDEFKALNASQISDLNRKLYSVYFYNPDKAKELSLNFHVASAQSGFKVMEVMLKTSWLQLNTNLFPNLKTLKVPTFILHGKQDIIPAWTAKEINDAIPHSEIIVLDHCGHFPYIEQPAQFFSEVNNFLHKIA